MKNNIKITDFLKKEYKNFSLYVIENRAIPSVIDGFKSSQRKIIYTANKTVKNSFNKVSTLAGNVIVHANFHHGNASLEDAVVGMSQDFKNNLPLFERMGQFGTLRAPFAAAPRYISVKLSENFNLIYKDFNLLKQKEDEGILIEPSFYLPIIPMILVNGTSGIAIGFATKIFNRNAKDVINACINVLQGKKIKTITPQINGFNGKIINDETNYKKWFFCGEFERVNTTTIKITNLPPSMSFEKFEKHLNGLVDKQKIFSWENLSKKDSLLYKVRIARDVLSKMKDNDINKLLNLIDDENENFSTLDEFNKLKIFNSAEEIIEYFVGFRLTYYEKRKENDLINLDEEILKLNNKVLFIKYIIDKKLNIANQNKESIYKQLEKYKLEKFNNSYDYLLSMPIHNITKEKYEELIKEIDKKKKEISIKKDENPKDVYLNELKELLKKI